MPACVCWDIIGLDVWSFVLNNVYEGAPDDPWRGPVRDVWFHGRDDEAVVGSARNPARASTAGSASGGERVIEALDWRTLEYHPAEKPSPASVQIAGQKDDLPERLRYLVKTGDQDRAGQFVWSVLRDLFVYAAGRVPEISDRIIEVDRSMCWGYGWTLGAISDVGRARFCVYGAAYPNRRL